MTFYYRGIEYKMPFKAVIETEADMLAEREAEYIQLKHALHLAQADRQHYIDEMQSTMSKMKSVSSYKYSCWFWLIIKSTIIVCGFHYI